MAWTNSRPHMLWGLGGHTTFVGMMNLHLCELSRNLPHIQAFWDTCKEGFAFTGVDTPGFDF